MSWTWTDTRGGKATRMALVHLPGYRLLQSAIYPRIVEEFQRGLAAIREMPCDVLITPHLTSLAGSSTSPPARTLSPELHRLRRPRGREHAQAAGGPARRPNSKAP